MALRYSGTGYCTECGEAVAETDGDQIADFEADLVERSEWAYEKHVADEHS